MAHSNTVYLRELAVVTRYLSRKLPNCGYVVVVLDEVGVAEVMTNIDENEYTAQALREVANRIERERSFCVKVESERIH